MKDKIDDKGIVRIFKDDIYYKSRLRNAYERYPSIHPKANSVDEDVWRYLKSRYNDSSSIKETIYRIAHGIEERPACKWCGGEVKFLGKPTIGFRSFCCDNCRLEHNIKYNFIQSPEYINKDKVKTCKAEEDTFYNIINEVFPDTKREYKDDILKRYGKWHDGKWRSFSCDYYIPSIDMFIEYNGYYTHGLKPYEGTTEDDAWMEDYISKHHVPWLREKWTVIDVEKRKIAKDTRLRFLELWPVDKTRRRKAIIVNGLKKIKDNPEDAMSVIDEISAYHSHTISR